MKEAKDAKDYYCSPIYTPKKLMAKMPPIRMGIAGIDPLRDSTLVVFKKLVQAGADCKGKLYKHLLHGYLEMDSYPFNLEECKRAFFDTIEHIHELANS